MKGFTIYCPECGGNGFTGYGTGYDSVCDNCSGEGLEFISLKEANKVMNKHGFIHLDKSSYECNCIDLEIEEYQEFGIVVSLKAYIIHLNSDTVWVKNLNGFEKTKIIEYSKEIIDKVRTCNSIIWY